MVEEEETKKKRITVGLDEFDYTVVSKMAANRKLSLSEVVRTIVHQWIEFNTDLLKKNYGILLKEVTDDILRDSYDVSVDKTLKPFEKAIIKELPDFFDLVETISINDLAEHFKVDNKVIKGIIYTHSKEIKKLGLDLVLKNDIIYKTSG
ncbi:MAG: hypothetical protein EU529_14805 [Promethearchaeota archaeon]|nr:MAG: hypothetical protein EU529_14805 [Candidatus Lokiarchaeota archaeon]